MKNDQPVSAIVIVKNEEANIKDCLKTLNWCGEVVVVDAYSNDKTLQIAKKFTDQIYQREWNGFAEQKQYALNKANNEWVLSVDADERITEELKNEIKIQIQDSTIYDGYYIPRKSYFLGKWIKHSGWYPGYQVRLFRQSKTQVTNRKVHEGFIVNGQLGYLNHPLIHYTHPTISDSYHKMNLYSSLEAEDRSGKKNIHWYDLVFHPLSAFLRKYFVQKGFLDGMPGFILAIITAQLKLALYLKLWERQNIRG